MLTLRSLVIVAAAVLGLAARTQAQTDDPDFPSGPTATIIDVLSSSPEFSILLGHLQRTGLVMDINRSRGATLLAPVNGAFYKEDAKDTEITRDLLLYHMLNASLLSDDVTSDMVLQSYLPSEVKEDPDHPQGMPVLVTLETDKDNKSSHSLMFNGVATAVELDLRAGYNRGVVQGVNSLLQIPRSLIDTVKHDITESATFADILDLQQSSWMHHGSNSRLFQHDSLATLLVPTDNAFDAVFNSVERSYLMSNYGCDDRDAILARHLIPQLLVPQELSKKGSARVALDGTVLDINKHYVVNSTFEPVKRNILASDGLINVYDSIITNEHSRLIAFTPEKYLHGLGASSFVAEAHLRDLDSLIDGSSTSPQTLFVCASDFSEVPAAPPNVLYQFVDGEHVLANITSPGDYLLKTKLRTHKMGDYNQRLKIHFSRKGAFSVNSNAVVSPEYTVGNTSIYIIENDLDLPASLPIALGPFFQSSYSLNFLESTDLLYPPKSSSPRTYLLPSRKAWESQELLKLYLETNETALEAVFKSLIFNTPFYTDDEPRNLTALDGSKVQLSIEHDESTGRMLISKVAKKKVKVGLHVDNDKYTIDAADILFDSGVVHSIDHISLPQTVEITAEDFVHAGNRSAFVDLLAARNLSHVLQMPSHPNETYTILVPNMDRMLQDGFDAESDDIDQLLALHILPGNPIANLFSGEPIDTLDKNVKLLGRNLTSSLHFIEIEDGVGKEVYVASRGDTSTVACPAGDVCGVPHTTVLFLDRYFSPAWVKQPFIRPPFQLKTHVAILLGAALGVIFVSSAIVTCMYAVVGRRKAEPAAEDGERQPLLADRTPSSEDIQPQEGRISPRSGNFYSTLSTASMSDPIPTAQVHDSREFGRHLNLPQAKSR